MKISKILLTGSTGLVGSNFLEHPLVKKFTIVSPRSSDLNLLNFNEVQKFLIDCQPDLVIHMAGKVGGIQANIKEPLDFFLENLDMGRNIVMATYKAGVKKLINLGSSCMYPRDNTEPLNEDMIMKGELEPTNEGYALAKIAVAHLCKYINAQDSKYDFKTLIPCNIYGPYDKFDPDKSHLVPAIIHKLHEAKVNGLDEVEIWGDGTARREFMFAGDLADAIFRSITKFNELPIVMNVGLGEDYSINEYYMTAAKVIGYNGNFVYNTEKPVGMSRKLVCIEKQLNWGWRCSTSLRVGIEKTYQYYLNKIKK